MGGLDPGAETLSVVATLNSCRMEWKGLTRRKGPVAAPRSNNEALGAMRPWEQSRLAWLRPRGADLDSVGEEVSVITKGR